MQKVKLGFGIGIIIVLLITILILDGRFGKKPDTLAKPWSYEQFRSSVESFRSYVVVYGKYSAEVEKIKKSGSVSTPEYRNKVIQRDSAMGRMIMISKEYNSNSEKSYRSDWKREGLPERLELPK